MNRDRYAPKSKDRSTYWARSIAPQPLTVGPSDPMFSGLPDDVSPYVPPTMPRPHLVREDPRDRVIALARKLLDELGSGWTVEHKCSSKIETLTACPKCQHAYEVTHECNGQDDVEVNLDEHIPTMRALELALVSLDLSTL